MAQKDIVGVFCDNCKIDYSFCPSQNPKVNVSLNQTAVERIDAFNQKNKPDVERDTLNNVASARVHLYAFKGEKFKMPIEIQRRAWQLAQEDMQWIESHFGITYESEKVNHEF